MVFTKTIITDEETVIPKLIKLHLCHKILNT